MSPLRPFECDVSPCLFCVHLHGHLAGEVADEHMREDEPACVAFAEGIPMEIWYANFDHREPYEGDQGVRFTPEVKAGE